ncbi:MAG: VOC family protein [Actinobacteria bacterium]|nr:VOC family protein [Actinomycetota bacterium]
MPDARGLLGAGRAIVQVGVVVADLEREARAISALLGISRWDVYTYGPGVCRDLTYRGAPADYSMRIALGGSSPVIELIQPLRGPNIYFDWLDESPEGLHHLAVQVEDLREGIGAAEAIGIAVLQSGRGYGLDGDGGFAYLDTYSQAGILLELIEIPERRREPEEIWTFDRDAPGGG